MSKHIDLIAIAVLVLAFAIASRMHDLIRMRMLEARVAVHLHSARPLVVAPPRVPAMSRIRYE